MRKGVYYFVAAAIVFSVGAWIATKYKTGPGPASERYMIFAGPISEDAKKLKGSFVVSGFARAAEGIPSTRIGGACLIADLVPHGIPANSPSPCSDDDQCTKALTIDQQNAGWSGYCRAQKCWTRPGSQDDLCNVDKENARAPGQTYTVPKSGAYDPKAAYKLVPNGSKITWMVHACLNGPLSGGKPPCAGGAGLFRKNDGQPSELAEP